MATERGNVRVLGIEGTAWAASAALYDSVTDDVTIETEAYLPDSGGIHPREAAEHMADHLPTVIERVLAQARETDGGDRDSPVDVDERSSSGQQAAPVDAVAFSRGPGLGPCLRLAGTSARALAQRLDVPLVGVNHMVAHLEIGRHRSGFSSPVCLNASGANAHLLGYRAGRYRVLGETMDTGVGNAIDKFTRHVGWSHPGGPKVEAAAADGEYVELPYVVKGMDFSFSGITSAAKEASDAGTPIEDVCYGLQEHVFAMLTEVSERALSLTGAGALVVGGGVAQNDRLREMLTTMCDRRGADFHAPEPRFLRDNAGMIAVCGAKMYAAGDRLPVAESSIDADFRPDEVPVTWRAGESWTADGDGVRTGEALQGAEAVVEIDGATVIKRRTPRAYRHRELDERLRKTRTRLEARLTSQARRQGVPTPVLRDVDVREGRLVFEHVGEADLRDRLTEARVRAVGRHLAAIHDAGFVHGDPTTRNVRVARSATDGSAAERASGEDDRTTREHAGATDGSAAERASGEDWTYLIDFGLAYFTDDPEDYAMDLHVFDQSLTGTADDPERLLAAVEDAYETVREDPGPTVERLRDIERRGRYQ